MTGRPYPWALRYRETVARIVLGRRVSGIARSVQIDLLGRSPTNRPDEYITQSPHLTSSDAKIPIPSISPILTNNWLCSANPIMTELAIGLVISLVLTIFVVGLATTVEWND